MKGLFQCPPWARSFCPFRACGAKLAKLELYIGNDERLAHLQPYSSYSVVSSIPASAKASLRSTQVPHLPQCFSPPL